MTAPEETSVLLETLTGGQLCGSAGVGDESSCFGSTCGGHHPLG